MGSIYAKLDRTVRICCLCDPNTVGDERHFLFYCPALKEERSLITSQMVEDGILDDGVTEPALLLSLSNTMSDEQQRFEEKRIRLFAK